MPDIKIILHYGGPEQITKDNVHVYLGLKRQPIAQVFILDGQESWKEV